MTESALLHCPIRGTLRVSQRAADQLTFTEEKQRIDAVRYLIQRQYPRDNFSIETTLFKIGNAGRNSFRTDFAVYDRASKDLKGLTLEKKLEHVRLLAEIKRDNQTAEGAKATQVRAALQLVPDIETLGVYWDDIEQRFFYRQIEGKRSSIHDAPISKIPNWGEAVGSTKLQYNDLDPAKDLVRVFDEIEDAFHTYVVDKQERYTLIQQLLLTKIHDENTHREGRRKNAPLDVQDYTVEAVPDIEVMRRMNEALSKAAGHYNVYLPSDRHIEDKFRCNAEVLKNATKILAPVNILGSKVQVIQQFYMKFAKSLYTWDLAQYFTPHEVIDFIVELVNPRAGEHVYDPACGSADFLISAYRRSGPGSEPCVWGSDNSPQAVQISILNMVLNGDGKTQIKNQDSLNAYTPSAQQFSVVLCNPPFGTRIVEKRYEVLKKFDMGHKWTRDRDGVMSVTEEVLDKQQTGILFAELCVRLAKPGGRVGIILPNGYLGNRTIQYAALREWLLCHTRIVSIVGFPRFTFKKSGADVSASVVVVERRRKPLDRSSDSLDYAFFAGTIESVGWRAGDKKAVPIYLRDQATGVLILDEDNEPVLDADFAAVVSEFLRSPSVDCFTWTIEDRNIPTGPQTEGVDIADVVRFPDLNLDPKRHSSKFKETRKKIEGLKHFSLGDVLEPVPTKRGKIAPEKFYQYVDIELVRTGEYDCTELRGWQLPDRAKLKAKSMDIFIAHIWSSAGKWFVASTDCDRLIVSNGCTQLRLKDGKQYYLPDLFVGLCSEAFCVQLRALATGSDGLAEIVDDDMLSIVLPCVLSQPEREQAQRQIDQLLAGETRFSRYARGVIRSTAFPIPPPRKSHCGLV